MKQCSILGIILLNWICCASCSSDKENVPCSFTSNTNDILYSGNTSYQLSRSPLDCIRGFKSFHSDTITSKNIVQNCTAIWSLVYDSLQLCMLEHSDSIKNNESREWSLELYDDLQKFLNLSFITDERIQFLSPEISSSKVMTATWVTGVFYIQQLFLKDNNAMAPFYELTFRQGRIISMRRLYPCQ